MEILPNSVVDAIIQVYSNVVTRSPRLHDLNNVRSRLDISEIAKELDAFGNIVFDKAPPRNLQTYLEIDALSNESGSYFIDVPIFANGEVSDLTLTLFIKMGEAESFTIQIENLHVL